MSAAPIRAEPPLAAPCLDLPRLGTNILSTHLPLSLNASHSVEALDFLLPGVLRACVQEHAHPVGVRRWESPAVGFTHTAVVTVQAVIRSIGVCLAVLPRAKKDIALALRPYKPRAASTSRTSSSS